MTKYIIKRLFYTVLTLWIVITVTFFLMHAIPGDPFTDEKKVPPQIKANLMAKYGLDKPLSEQYVMYLGNVIHGDLGISIANKGRRINDIIAYSFPTSAKLGGVAVLFATILGIIMGIIAALKQGRWQDNICMVISTVGVTVPSFVMATLLMYIFALKLKLLPPIGFDGPENYIMPALALGGYSMAFIARLSRSSLLDVIRQDYIKVAKAKGLSKSKVILKHALKNSLLPTVTYLGPVIAGILTGSFVVESIFGIPGLGREFVISISNRDYTEILGVTIFYSAFLILCNLVVDLLYVVIDPRIKLES